MSESPKYHPVIEQLVETEGEDAGRIKVKEFAEDLAHDMHAARETETQMIAEGWRIKKRSEEERSAEDHAYVAQRIAERAFQSPHLNRNFNEIATGVVVGQQLAEIKHRKEQND